MSIVPGLRHAGIKEKTAWKNFFFKDKTPQLFELGCVACSTRLGLLRREWERLSCWKTCLQGSARGRDWLGPRRPAALRAGLWSSFQSHFFFFFASWLIKSICFEHLGCTVRERESVLIKHTEQSVLRVAANSLDPGSEAALRACPHLRCFVRLRLPD